MSKSVLRNFRVKYEFRLNSRSVSQTHQADFVRGNAKVFSPSRNAASKMKKPHQVFRDLETLVDVAGSRGPRRLGRFLRKIYFDVNHAGLHGRTPLTYACLGKNLDLVNALLEAGADVNVADRFSRTPMHEAVLVGSLNLVRVLLDRGATVDVPDHFANTPLSIALLEKNDLKMVELLVRNGADVNFDRGGLSFHLFLGNDVKNSTRKRQHQTSNRGIFQKRASGVTRSISCA